MYRCFSEWVTKLSRKQGIFTPELILSSFHFTPQLILSNIIPEGGEGGGEVIVPSDPQETMDQYAYPSPHFWL